MQNNKLHIVAFDVPCPPDYGGAVDMYYKIKNLAAAGCEIYLHCYEYGRGRQDELLNYCKQVLYYHRNTGLTGLSPTLPYIVSSRRDKDLLKRLLEVDAPILFEGVHTTFFLSHPALQQRFKAIRIHNVEHDYYLQLSQKERSFFRKTYFAFEAAQLKKYEHQLGDAQAFYALSRADSSYFQQLYPNAGHKFIAPFHPNGEVNIKTGLGDYCLYHGNLSHPENREAALYLLKEVIPSINMQVIIAGKNPAQDIIDLCKTTPNCRLVANPSQSEMEDLIKNAHIHILPTFQLSGIKLKLLSALFSGRHVIVNPPMLHGTGLTGVCTIANNTNEFKALVNQLVHQPFTETDIQNRAQQLLPFSNENNAELLKKLIQN